MTAAPRDPSRASPPAWAVWALVALVLAAVVAALALLPLREWLGALVSWLHDLGAAGLALYAVVYVAAIAVAVPGSILTMGAGFAWGPLWGFLLVSPVSVVGACLAFLIGRHVLRSRVAAWVARSSRLRAVDEAVAVHGGTMVALLRLSPIMPFNVLNYVIGATRLSVGRYALATWLGTMPGTFLYAYLGSTVPALGAPVVPGTEAADARQALFWGGLAATVVATVFIGRIARRALASRVALAALTAEAGAAQGEAHSELPR